MRRLLFTLIVTGVVAAPLAAQQASAPSLNESAQAAAPSAQTPQASAPAAPVRPPSLAGAALQGTNVRLEITITDTFSGTPQKKTAAMTVMSGQTGMIRTDNVVFEGRSRVRLNVDAMLTAYQSGQVSTRLTVSYLPPPRQSPTSAEARNDNSNQPGALEESITVVLHDGQPLVLSESADPATDRKVTLEAKATILK